MPAGRGGEKKKARGKNIMFIRKEEEGRGGVRAPQIKRLSNSQLIGTHLCVYECILQQR